jgi:paraquat-inducible protein B
MADAPNLPDLPEAVAAPKSRRSLQLVWLIPIVAALIGGWLAVKSFLDKGPTITIQFATAEGLETGKTKIKYKDVDVGLVTGIALAPDTSHVVVTAELVKDAKGYLVEDTRFWVVRPRVSGGSVTGIGTLISGSFIGMDIGASKEPKAHFKGLEVPPVVNTGEPGRTFVLLADNAGSLDAGSPLYFRRIKAGQIISYDLDKDGRGILVKVFVAAPYDKFVTDNTRFWHASGIDITLNSSGITVNTQSAVSLLIGGLAFETPLVSADLPPAKPDTEFRLFPNRTEALRNPETDVMIMAMVFEESVRGLAPGAEVDFRGVVVGTVTHVRPHVDVGGKAFKIRVRADFFPRRLRSRDRGPVMSNEQRRELFAGMIKNGLRAQLRTASLLTGQLYVALDFFPDAPKVQPKKGVKLDDDDLPEMPVVKSSILQLQEAISAIASKVQKFPLEQVGADLQTTLRGATKLIEHIDNDIAPELRSTMSELRATMTEARKALESMDQALKPNSPMSQDARDAMREVARAAAAFRALSDYLERHPEALISGKRGDSRENAK